MKGKKMNNNVKEQQAKLLINFFENYLNNLFNESIIYANRILYNLSDLEKKAMYKKVHKDFISEKNNYLKFLQNLDVDKQIVSFVVIADTFIKKVIPSDNLKDPYGVNGLEKSEYSNLQQTLLYEIKNSGMFSEALRYQAGSLLIRSILKVELCFRYEILKKRIKSIKHKDKKNTAKLAMDMFKSAIKNTEDLDSMAEFFDKYSKIVHEIEGRYLLFMWPEFKWRNHIS